MSEQRTKLMDMSFELIHQAQDLYEAINIGCSELSDQAHIMATDMCTMRGQMRDLQKELDDLKFRVVQGIVLLKYTDHTIRHKDLNAFETYLLIGDKRGMFATDLPEKKLGELADPQGETNE